jgi:pilus assembly protein CpaC
MPPEVAVPRPHTLPQVTALPSTRGSASTSRVVAAAWLLAAVVTVGADAAPTSATAATAATPASAAGAALPARIDMFVGDTRVLDVRSRRVAVGNGEILSVSTLDPGQLLLLAEGAGTTSLALWLRDGSRHRIEVNVTAANLDVVLDHVRKMLDGVPTVSARIAGTRIVLEGDHVSDADQRRVAAVVDAFGGQVVNFVGRIGWNEVLHFDVRIVEVRRSAVRDLGIRWDTQANGPAVGVVADLATNDLFRVVPPAAAVPGIDPSLLPLNVSPAATYAGITSTLTSRIQLLEQRGDAVLVAQPTLSCRSGGSARFISGGEFPIPVTDALGSTDVEFKEYGVILDVRPVTDRGGVIYARIDTEISQIDESTRVLGVPGLLKRRSQTELNLREGEVAVLGGLVSRTRGRDVQQVPGLGSVPLLGSLFKSTGRRDVESELLILIVPRIVRHATDPDALARDPVAEGVARSRELLRKGGIEPTSGRLILAE